MSGSINVMRAAHAALLWRSKQPYDGVLGTLPQWIPKNFHIEFERTRDTLLQDGYAATEIQHFMDKIVEIEQIALANPNDPPEMHYVMPPKIYEAVSTLAMFQKAVRLGEGQGLAYLTDTRTAGLITTGKQRSEQQKSFREARQKLDKEKHEQWRKWQADEKASNLQFAKLKSKQAQAKSLKKKHTISDEVDTIAKRLEPLAHSKKK